MPGFCANARRSQAQMITGELRVAAEDEKSGNQLRYKHIILLDDKPAYSDLFLT